jgi:hypothetical protein
VPAVTGKSSAQLEPQVSKLANGLTFASSDHGGAVRAAPCAALRSRRLWLLRPPLLVK